MEEYLLFFTFGMLSIGTQTLVVRSLIASFSGSEIMLGFSLGIWLLGTAGGGIASQIFLPRITNYKRTYLYISLVLIIFIPLSVSLALTSKRLFGFIPFEIAPLYFLLLSAVISTIIPSFTFGLSFAISVDYIKSKRDSPIKTVYLWESIGSFIGGGIVAVGVIPFINHLSGALILCGISIIPGVVLLETRWKILASVFVFITGITGFLARQKLGIIVEKLKTGEKVERYQTGYIGDYSLLKRGDTYYILLNTSPVFTYPEYKIREPNVFIPLAYNKKEVLIIGGSIPVEGRLAPSQWEIIIYPPIVAEMEKTFFKNSKKLHIITKEPLLFLRNTAKKYDAIVVFHSDPYTAGDNRFFTKEFFRSIKEHLLQGGIFIFSAGEPSNYLSDEQSEYLASLWNTARKVFTFVKIFPLSRFFFICSDTRFSLNPLWKSEFGKYFRKGYTVWDASPERIAYYSSTIKEKRNKVISNRILHPSSYLYFLQFYSSRRGVSLKNLFTFLKKIHIHILIPILFLLFLLVTGLFFRNVPYLGSGFAVGYVGLFSETALLILYQLFYGFLYFSIGLFITSFMGGISLGASGKGYGRKGIILASLGLSFACFGTFFLLSSSALFDMPSGMGTFFFALLHFLFGFLSGMMFKENSQMLKGDYGKLAGLMDGLDHIGGALAASLTPLFLIPNYGFEKMFIIVGFIPLIPLIALAPISSK